MFNDFLQNCVSGCQMPDFLMLHLPESSNQIYTRLIRNVFPFFDNLVCTKFQEFSNKNYIKKIEIIKIICCLFLLLIFL
jgi:hypothetical protein